MMCLEEIIDRDQLVKRDLVDEIDVEIAPFGRTFIGRVLE